MKEVIVQKLKEIEEKENVKILHCVESGSRAWGFASPDSDYDVRFIYLRPKEYYLRLDRTRDVIEWQLDDTLDINGWDLQKTLRLLHKSNPTIFEWNSSPIVYKTTPQWQELSELINGYFLQKSGLYHYISTAKRNYREHLKGETVRLKKYFYVLRPILACRWIIAEQTPPPMLFSELAEKYLDSSIKDDVERLLELKMKSREVTLGKKIDPLNSYIDSSLEEIEEIIERMPGEKQKGLEDLNEIFLKLVFER